MAAQPFFNYLPAEPGMQSLYEGLQGPQTAPRGYMPSEPGMQGLMAPPRGPTMDFSGSRPMGGFTVGPPQAPEADFSGAAPMGGFSVPPAGAEQMKKTARQVMQQRRKPSPSALSPQEIAAIMAIEGAQMRSPTMMGITTEQRAQGYQPSTSAPAWAQKLWGNVNDPERGLLFGYDEAKATPDDWRLAEGAVRRAQGR